MHMIEFNVDQNKKLGLQKTVRCKKALFLSLLFTGLSIPAMDPLDSFVSTSYLCSHFHVVDLSPGFIVLLLSPAAKFFILLSLLNVLNEPIHSDDSAEVLFTFPSCMITVLAMISNLLSRPRSVLSAGPTLC